MRGSIDRRRRCWSCSIDLSRSRVSGPRRAIAHRFVVFSGAEKWRAVFKTKIQRLVCVGAVAVRAAFHRNQFTLIGGKDQLATARKMTVALYEMCARFWSAPAKRRSDGALDRHFAGVQFPYPRGESKAVSSLRFATPLQIHALIAVPQRPQNFVVAL